MKKTWPLLLSALLVLTVFSCRKDNDTPATQCVAGTGGDVNLVVFALHNSDTLKNYASHPDTAFVKFGATAFPGTNPSSYDTYFVSEEGEDHIHVHGLKCGQYFVYRTAYNEPDSTRYIGTLSINITKTSGEIDTAIIVN